MNVRERKSERGRGGGVTRKKRMSERQWKREEKGRLYVR